MKKGAKIQPIATGKQFNAAEIAARVGVSEAEVIEYKAAFDLFDTDQGGSIDTKGKFSLMRRA